MEEKHPWECKLASRWPPGDWKDLTVLVAISGGGDSVALARGLLATRERGDGRIVAAHFDHRLRGADSDEDARFVNDFCRRHGIPLKTGHFSPAARGEAVSEERARNARYAFLRRTAEKLGARYVATGHTRDDQVETVLHRFFRGTGIRGLSGMPRVRPLGPAVVLIRPLLDFGRDETRSYLNALNQPFREDASNRDPRFTRNRIRLELLPYLRENLNDYVDAAVVRLARLAGETQEFVEAVIRSTLTHTVLESTTVSVTLDRTRLVGESPFLVRELLLLIWRERKWPLKNMSFQCWQEAVDLIQAEGNATTRKRVLPGNILMEVHDAGVVFRRGNG